MAYTDTTQLQEQVEALRNRRGGLLRQYLYNKKADKLSDQLSQQEQVNKQTYDAELARFLRERQTGAPEVPYVLGGGYTHPDLQKEMLAAELKEADYEARARNPVLAQPGYGNSVVYGKEGDQYRGFRVGPGGLDPLPMPEGVDLVPPGSVLARDPQNVTDVNQAAADVEVANIRRIANEEHQADLDTTINQRTQQISESQDKQRQMNQWIDQAIENAGFWTTGFAGTMLEVIPGTPAYDLVAAIDTIKANVGFDKLQEMRNNSPTGGALGQVSEFENRLLQSVLGNLENSQSTAQLKQNLEELKLLIDQIVNRGIGRFNADYSAPGVGDVVGDALRIIEGR